MLFNAPPYFFLLGLVPALVALYAYAARRKRRALDLFLDPANAARLLPGLSRARQRLKAVCLIGAVAALVVGLTQPQWGKSLQDVARQGRDLVFLVDVSLSMLAEDPAPNRLERAKRAIKALVAKIRHQGGHRLAIVAFAGRPTLQCPLTRDYDFFLQRLDEMGTGTVARKGTLIGDAIRQTLSGFITRDHEFADIILITDGEDHNSLPLEAAKTAAAQQVGLYTVGVGDPVEGARIPVEDGSGRTGYLQHQEREVVSRMRQSLLLDMARTADGIYLPAGTGAIELDQIYDRHIASKARRRVDETATEQSVHRYQWFVALAIGLLALEMLIGESARKPE